MMMMMMMMMIDRSGLCKRTGKVSILLLWWESNKNLKNLDFASLEYILKNSLPTSLTNSIDVHKCPRAFP
uniref:Uncharacterized protein n=1 Tax=Glossina palpalis gambiensis TaxID=67801 RepID=A0A1B0BDG0_9MUSC